MSKPIKFKNKGFVKTDVNDNKRKPKRKKKIESNFLITVNTNRRYPANSEELKKAKKKLMKIAHEYTELFENGRFVTITGVGEWNSDYIKKVKTKGAVERGEKFDQLHAHIHIQIKHFTNVRINIPKSKEFFVDKTGLDNLHFHVRYYKKEADVSEVLKNYLEKNRKKPHLQDL